MSAPAPAERLDLDPTAGPNVIAPLDPLVVNPGRLSILLALSAGEPGVEFVDLRRRTRLTDGNLASHAKRLADGGLIGIDKQFRGGKPVTTYLLTDSGKQALHAHVEGLVVAVRVAPMTFPDTPRSTPGRASLVTAPPAQAVATPAGDDADDDWVD